MSSPRILPVDPARPDPDAIATAAELLRGGGLVAFPTETVYGLGAHALDARAVRRIYEAKGRPSYNPLIVHLHDAGEIETVARAWPESAARLAERFWPGPLTLVVPKQPSVPDVVTAGLDTVAVRVPAHPVALALLDAARIPIAAPSANRFTRVSPTTAEHVRRSLGSAVDLILDGGATDVGIESTVVDVSGERPILLRPGLLSADDLAAVVGPVDVAAGISGAAPRPSPGMVDRHYAPRAAVRLFGPGPDDDAFAAARELAARGACTGAIIHSDVEPPVARCIRLPGEPAGYARALYAALHTLDDAECALVLIERVPGGAAWAGVRDRIERAAR